MSQKSSDHECFPLCRFHHQAFHGPCWRGNPFWTWTKEDRRAWQVAMVLKYAEWEVEPETF